MRNDNVCVGDTIEVTSGIVPIGATGVVCGVNVIPYPSCHSFAATIPGGGMNLKWWLNKGEFKIIKRKATDVTTPQVTKISEVKVGDAVLVHKIRIAKFSEILCETPTNLFGTIQKVVGLTEDGPAITIRCTDLNWDLWEGDFDLVKTTDPELSTLESQLEETKAKIDARKKQLEEEANRPKLPEIERKWLKNSGDCGVVYEAVKNYESLELAYPEYKDRSHKRRAWMTILGVMPSTDSDKLVESGVNPFKLSSYKIQIELIERNGK